MEHIDSERLRIAREGMYRPEFEGDACGVGLVAATDGKPSRRVVASAIDALKAVWHRGAVDADGRLYFIDRQFQRIWRWSEAGRLEIVRDAALDPPIGPAGYPRQLDPGVTARPRDSFGFEHHTIP